MSSILAKWMSVMLAVIFMTTPLLMYLDSLHRSAVDTVLYETAKKAAIEGMFTQDLIEQMVHDLTDNYNFQKASIQIRATSQLTPRNEYIEGEIEVPRTPLFIFDLFNQEAETITRQVRIMSEYVATP